MLLTQLLRQLAIGRQRPLKGVLPSLSCRPSLSCSSSSSRRAKVSKHELSEMPSCYWHSRQCLLLNLLATRTQINLKAVPLHCVNSLEPQLSREAGSGGVPFLVHSKHNGSSTDRQHSGVPGQRLVGAVQVLSQWHRLGSALLSSRLKLNRHDRDVQNGPVWRRLPGAS